MSSEPGASGRLDPAAVASRTFPTSFRGFDQESVRDFLLGVSRELERLGQLAAAAATIEDAEARAAAIVGDAEERAKGIVEEAIAQGPGADAERIVADAHAEARRLVGEAQAAREKVLGDLGRRRKVAKTQVEQLHAARERLLSALVSVREEADATVTGLRKSLPEAKAASDSAARRMESEPAPTIDQLESELHALRLVGLGLDEPEPPEPEPEPEPEPGPPRAMPRVVRHRRATSNGLPEADLHPVDPSADFEEVRLVTREEADEPSSLAAGLIAVDDEQSDAPEEPSLADVRSTAALIAVEHEQPDAPEEPSLADVRSTAALIAVEDEQLETAELEVGVIEADVAATATPADEPEAPPHAKPSPEAVDALFARLRAGRATRTAAALEVLEEPAPTEPEPEEEPEPAATVDVDEVAVHVGGGADREGLLARRDAVVDPVVASLNRRLKRLLADGQNELLDRLRRVATPVDALAGGDEAGWAQAAAPDLAAAANAGAAFHGGPAAEPCSPGDVADLADHLAGALVRPLTSRLRTSLAGVDDGDAAADRVRAAYREWRSSRLGPEVDRSVLAAFATGILRGSPAGSRFVWVVDDGGAPCPDCEDDALEGPVAAGEPFPTGHPHPPAHTGCRCLLVPASS